MADSIVAERKALQENMPALQLAEQLRVNMLVGADDRRVSRLAYAEALHIAGDDTASNRYKEAAEGINQHLAERSRERP